MQFMHSFLFWQVAQRGLPQQRHRIHQARSAEKGTVVLRQSWLVSTIKLLPKSGFTPIPLMLWMDLAAFAMAPISPSSQHQLERLPP